MSDLVYDSYNGKMVEKNTYKALKDLRAAAKKDGIDTKKLLRVASGYRSDKVQAGLYKGDSTYVARPGNSPHRTGRTVDLSMSYPINSHYIKQLKTTKEYKWLLKNAKKFGFYNYPVEPWHWEYNP